MGAGGATLPRVRANNAFNRWAFDHIPFQTDTWSNSGPITGLFSGGLREQFCSGRSPKGRIPDEALDLFVAMEKCECTCPPRDWAGEYWHQADNECAGCETWWRLNSRLVDLLKLRPWQWPAYTHPDARNPWPEGSYMHSRWAPDAEGQERFRQLEAALAARAGGG
jgi:hypothetical protein